MSSDREGPQWRLHDEELQNSNDSGFPKTLQENCVNEPAGMASARWACNVHNVFETKLVPGRRGRQSQPCDVGTRTLPGDVHKVLANPTNRADC